MSPWNNAYLHDHLVHIDIHIVKYQKNQTQLVSQINALIPVNICLQL